MRPLSQKLLTGYKTANPKWDEQHVSVKLGHHLASYILLQNMSATEALTGWPAMLEQRVVYTATRFPPSKPTISLVTISKSIR